MLIQRGFFLSLQDTTDCALEDHTTGTREDFRNNDDSRQISLGGEKDEEDEKVDDNAIVV